MQRIRIRPGEPLGKRHKRLILAAKQIGWLNASIEHKNDTTGTTKPPRMASYSEENPPPFIELDAGGYLLEMLMEAGPIKQAPMGGACALDWADLTAYLAAYPVEVEHDERLLIIQMSSAFVTGMHEGKNPFSIPPGEREIKE